jgi:hypothetical protein
MPIRWSALELSQELDEAEAELAQAKPFIDRAMAKMREIRSLPHLPRYIDEPVMRLDYEIEQKLWLRIAAAIKGIRDRVPEGAIEAERGAGKQPSLELDIKPCTIRKDDDFDFWLKRQLNR